MTETQTLARIICQNHRFLFFIYCALSKDYPQTKWNNFDTINAPIPPNIARTYVDHTSRRFPRAAFEANFRIENA